MQIEGALRVDAFVDAEELPVLFWDKGVPTIRTHETDRRGNNLPRDERLATDLALVLSVAAIVIIEIVVRSATEGTDNISRDGFAVTALDGSDGFAILPEIVLEEELPVLFDEWLNDGKTVGSEFLVLRRVRVLKSPLLEGDISAKQIQEPANRFILFLNYSK